MISKAEIIKLSEHEWKYVRSPLSCGRDKENPISGKRYVRQQPKAISNSSLYVDGSPHAPLPLLLYPLPLLLHPLLRGASHVASTVRLIRDCRTFRQCYRADIFCYRTFLFPSAFCPPFLRALCRPLPSYLLLCLCSSSTLPPTCQPGYYLPFTLVLRVIFFMVMPPQRRLPLSVLGIT